MDNPLDQVIPSWRKPILGWPPGSMDIFIICRIKFHMPMEIPWFMSYEASTNTTKQALTQFMDLHLAATLPMKIRCKWKERKGLKLMCTHRMVPWYRENPFLWKIDNLISWKMWMDFGNPVTCLWTTRTYELIMAISKEERKKSSQIFQNSWQFQKKFPPYVANFF